MRKEIQKTRLDHLRRVKREVYNRAAEEFTQQIKTKADTLKRYKNKIKQSRKYRYIQSNQSKFCHDMDGKSQMENIIPDKKETKDFRSGMWDKNIKHNEKADWIQKVAKEMLGNQQ